MHHENRSVKEGRPPAPGSVRGTRSPGPRRRTHVGFRRLHVLEERRQVQRLDSVRLRHRRTDAFRDASRRSERRRHQEFLPGHVRNLRQTRLEPILRAEHADRVAGLRTQGPSVRQEVSDRMKNRKWNKICIF